MRLNFFIVFFVLFSISVFSVSPFFCSSNSQCNDGNPSTLDLCVRPGESDSGCTNLNCSPVCSSNSDCDDGDSSTVDVCVGTGRCTARCVSVPASTFNDGVCQDYESKCSVPNDCGSCYKKLGACSEVNCVGDSCKTTISLGCCGNGLCEFKEDYSNCSEDCKPRNLSLIVLNDFSSKKFFRGDTVLFKVKAEADGVLINNAKVKVIGFFGELVLVNDGKHKDGTAYDGVYAGEYLIPKEAEKGAYNIELIVDFAKTKNSINKTLFLDPIVELNDISVPSSVLLGEEINLKFRTRRESVNVPAKISLIAKLKDSTKTFFSKELESNNDGLVEFSYRTSFLDSPGEWVLTVKAIDFNGNVGVKDYLINVKNPSSTSFLKIRLVNDLNSSFLRGEKIDFNLFVSDELGAGVSNSETFATFNGKQVKFKDNNSGYYSYSFNLPFDSKLGKNSFLIESKKQVDGKLFSGSKEVSFDVNSINLNTELISPFNHSIKIGETVLFRIRVVYPNGKPVTGPSILPVKIAGRDVNLLFVGDGFFEKNYKILQENKHLILFDVNSTDLFGNKIVFSTELNVLGVSVFYYLQEYALTLFLIIVVVVGLFFLTFSIYFKSKSKKKLIERKQELIQEIKSIQKQFFVDGFMDKNSYDKSMLRLETELKEINKQLKGD